jgi:ribose transport system substrate-binding protein
MKRVMCIALAVLLVASALTFATGKKDVVKKQLTFAYMSGILDPFMQMIEKGAAAKAKELGVTLMTAEYPKSWGPEVQVPILEAMVAKGGIDFLLVVPTSVEALKVPLKKISDKGIPMVTCDTYIGNGDYSKPSDFSFPLAYIGTDNEQGGYEVGKRLAEMVGKTGKVYMNTTNPDVSSVTGRRDGFLRAMKEYPNIKVVGIDYNLDSQEKAQAQTAAVLQANPDLKGIFGTNLFSAQGAYQAVANAGLAGVVKIAVWDATVDLIKALKDKKVDLVLAQKPYEIGYLAVEWGYKYLTQKATVPKVIRPGFFFFTRENMDTAEAQSYIYK